MSMNLLEFVKQVRKNTRMLSHHIGLGGNAHAQVDDLNSGFMTPKQKATLETASADSTNALGVRIWKKSGTDVLTLPPGRYEISGAINNPLGTADSSYIEYDITTTDNGQRRQYSAIVSSTGLKFRRTTHTDGTPTSGSGGWRLDVPMVVWSGSAQSGTLTYQNKLDDGLSIDKTIVRYSTSSGQGGEVSILGKNGGFTAITEPNLADDQSSNYQIYESRVTSTRSSLTIDSNFATIHTNNGDVYSDEKFITITRIEVI